MVSPDPLVDEVQGQMPRTVLRRRFCSSLFTSEISEAQRESSTSPGWQGTFGCSGPSLQSLDLSPQNHSASHRRKVGDQGWRPALECVPRISLMSPGAVTGQRDQHVEHREGLGRIVSPAGLLLCTEVEVSYQGLESSDPFLSMPVVRSGLRGNLWRTLRVNTVLVSAFFFLSFCSVLKETVKSSFSCFSARSSVISI